MLNNLSLLFKAFNLKMHPNFNRIFLNLILDELKLNLCLENKCISLTMYSIKKTRKNNETINKIIFYIYYVVSTDFILSNIYHHRLEILTPNHALRVFNNFDLITFENNLESNLYPFSKSRKFDFILTKKEIEKILLDTIEFEFQPFIVRNKKSYIEKLNWEFEKILFDII